MNINPEAAADEYRERVIRPYRDRVPEEEIQALTEQLAGQCAVEVAAFDEFARLVAEPSLTAFYDHVIFDTAPTGHTLRLLSLPSVWSGYIQTSPQGASCPGPLAGLEARQEEYAATVRALADPARTALVLVSRPEDGALREAARAGTEVATLGMHNQQLLINAVLTHPLPGDAGPRGAPGTRSVGPLDCYMPGARVPVSVVSAAA
jgi:arsenite/tail-anchored protein-transporting ATPase